MRNYIILNGTNSNTIAGLLIQELAPISKPLMRTETEEIDGRDGDISTPLGFSAYDKEITIGLYGTYDINAIIAFFNSEGTVTFSNEPDKYYNYQIFQQIDFDRLIRFRTATVTFHCQPFKYGTTGESQTLESGNPVSDEGTSLVLEGSALAPFSQFDLKGNTVQDGTPTPDAPVAVQTVTGENVVKICGKNLLKLTPATGATTRGITTTIDSTTGAMTFSGTTTAGYPWLIDSPVSIKAGTYTLSIDQTLPYLLAFRFYYDSSNYATVNINAGSTTATATLANDTTRIVLLYNISSSGVTVSGTTIKPMVELGSTPTTYEPYQGQSYEVNLGKNLFDKDANQYLYGYFDNSSLQIVSASSTGRNAVVYLPCEPSTTYAINAQSLATCNIRAISTTEVLPANGVAVPREIASGFDAATFTTPSSAHYIVIRYRTISAEETIANNIQAIMASLQVEKGSQATSYAAYFEPIELCKIGTYQDYIYKDGSDWKIHKATQKIVFNGSETWNTWNNKNSCIGFYHSDSTLAVIGVETRINGALLCDKFSEATLRTDIVYGDVEAMKQCGGGGAQYIAIGIELSRLSDTSTSANAIASFKTWLSSNTPIFYGTLATPIDITITNEALIEQLDAIYNQAHAYKTRTYVDSNAATGNVPHIIAATVVGDASGTITNAGNIYSKPKLTVYGSGDIGIYLNGVQMFQIALGSDGYITIDTNLMEAYKDNLQTLKNRQVTGDYSNFKLPVGSSTISFSGVVASCVVENYSRWL